MSKTLVSIAIPFTFAAEGNYDVMLEGQTAKISVAYVQNNMAMDEVMGIKSIGKVTLIPDDPEGIVNISKVTIEFPFLFRSLSETQDKNGVRDSGKSSLAGTADISIYSKQYLNRLSETIRACTRRYWIKSISERHLNIYNIETEGDDGKRRRIFMFKPPSGYDFPIEIVNEKAAMPSILEKLKTESIIPFEDNLIYDSLQFFNYGKFAEAIILCNIGLEVFAQKHLLCNLISQGFPSNDAQKKVSKIFSNGFEKGMKKSFFKSKDENALASDPMWGLIRTIRYERRRVVHPVVAKITHDDAQKSLVYLLQVIAWLNGVSYVDRK